MKQSIECCDAFIKMRNNFNWYSYKDDKGNKVLCMPVMRSPNGDNLRVNHCPSCGAEVRSIELRETN